MESLCTNQIAKIAGVTHHRVNAWLSKDFGFRFVEAKVGKGRKRRLEADQAFAVLVAMRMADSRFPGQIAVQWWESGLISEWWSAPGNLEPVTFRTTPEADLSWTVNLNRIRDRLRESILT
jgi:transposase